MPLEGRAALQLGLLLLAVPAQYFFTTYMPSDEITRSHAIRRSAKFSTNPELRIQYTNIRI